MWALKLVLTILILSLAAHGLSKLLMYLYVSLMSHVAKERHSEED